MMFTLYMLGFVVTFAFILWANSKTDEPPRVRPVEVTSDEYYEDDGDGAALILGALVGSLIWPITIGIFIYYRYFDKN